VHFRTAVAIRMAWSTDGSNTAPSTLHVTNTAPFSHRITQQTYATVFYSVIRAKTDLRRSPSSLRVGLVCSDGEQYSAVVWAGVLGTTQEWCTETQHAITICMEVFNVTSSCTCPIPYTCTQSANYQSSIHKVQQMSLELLHHQIKTLQISHIQYIYTYSLSCKNTLCCTRVGMDNG